GAGVGLAPGRFPAPAHALGQPRLRRAGIGLRLALKKNGRQRRMRHTLTRSISVLGITLAPIAAVPAEAMTIYVSNEKGNSISVIDGDTMEVTATVDVGNRPRGIALSPDYRYLYI